MTSFLIGMKMNKIDGNSRATILFSLNWESDEVRHKDELWTDQVNMWRDCFTPEFASALLGTQEGQKVEKVIGVDSFLAPFNKKKFVQLPPSRFYKPDLPEKQVNAITGRYYPQVFLHGLVSAFQVPGAPARCISRDGKSLRFDLNHPLAGHELKLSAEVLEIHQQTVERGGRCEDWVEKLCSSGPGMQARYDSVATDFFQADKMQPENTSPDQLFYRSPRMVQHLDSAARKTITRHYAKLISSGARVLDLMGSWDSHLPDDIDFQTLTVLGMNQEELLANQRATETLLQDLNQNHELSFMDNSFEAIVCTASIEYLTDPLKVFSEIQRLLVPGGVFALAFSNRWFPPKVIKIWTELHEFERLGMVLEMFHRTSGFTDIHTLTRQGEPRPDDDPYQEYTFSDPVYMAWGFKKLQ